MNINEASDRFEYELGKAVGDVIIKSIDYFVIKPRKELTLLTEQNSIMINNQNEFLRLMKERR